MAKKATIRISRTTRNSPSDFNESDPGTSGDAHRRRRQRPSARERRHAMTTFDWTTAIAECCAHLAGLGKLPPPPAQDPALQAIAILSLTADAEIDHALTPASTMPTLTIPRYRRPPRSRRRAACGTDPRRRRAEPRLLPSRLFRSQLARATRPRRPCPALGSAHRRRHRTRRTARSCRAESAAI